MITFLSLSQTSNKNTWNNAHNLQSTAGCQAEGGNSEFSSFQPEIIPKRVNAIMQSTDNS